VLGKPDGLGGTGRCPVPFKAMTPNQLLERAARFYHGLDPTNLRQALSTTNFEFLLASYNLVRPPQIDDSHRTWPVRCWTPQDGPGIHFKRSVPIRPFDQRATGSLLRPGVFTKAGKWGERAFHRARCWEAIGRWGSDHLRNSVSGPGPVQTVPYGLPDPANFKTFKYPNHLIRSLWVVGPGRKTGGPNACGGIPCWWVVPKFGSSPRTWILSQLGPCSS